MCVNFCNKMIINEPVRPRFNLLSLVAVFQWFINKVIFIITLVCVFSSPKIEIYECGLTFSLVLRQSNKYHIKIDDYFCYLLTTLLKATQNNNASQLLLHSKYLQLQ